MSGGMQGFYYGGYPWKDFGILTAADLNAAIALALQGSGITLPPIPPGSITSDKLATPWVMIGSTQVILGQTPGVTTLSGLADPTNPQDVATKHYVDTVTAIPDGSITNAKLAHSSITLGTTTINLGDTVTTFTGIYDPVGDLDVANKHYVDAHAGSGGGGGGIPDAPADGNTYGRHNAAWVPVLGVVSGVASMSGQLVVTHSGTGPPVNSGTTQSAGLVTRMADNTGLILDMGGNDGSGFWLDVTNSNDLSQHYTLLLNPLGGQVHVGAGGLVVDGNSLFLGSLTVAGIFLGGTDHYIYDAGSGALGFRAGPSGGPDAYFSMSNTGVFQAIQVKLAGYGIKYSGIGSTGDSHLISFGWDGTHFHGWIDGIDAGWLAMNGDLANYLPLSGGTLSGNLFVPSNLFQSLFARIGGLNTGGDSWAALNSAFNGLANSGAMGIGWNYNSGLGETDFFINRGGGSRGGLAVWDFPNVSGPVNLLMQVDSTNGLQVPQQINSTGTSAAFFFADRGGGGGVSWAWYSSGNVARLYGSTPTTGDRLTIDPGGNVLANGSIKALGELQSTYSNGLRIAYGSYGTFFRNDSTTFYLMITNPGDPYGGWGSLRPFQIDLASGRVSMQQGLDILGGNLYVAGSVSVASGVIYTPSGGYFSGDGSNLYLHLPTGNGYISFYNSAGTSIAHFDNIGNFYTLTNVQVYGGSCFFGTSNAQVYGDANSLGFRLPTGNNGFWFVEAGGSGVAHIDNAGDLYIRDLNASNNLTVSGNGTISNLNINNDCITGDVYRRYPVGGSYGANLELINGSGWGYTSFGVFSSAGPAGIELRISPDNGGSQWAIWADSAISDARLKLNIRDSEIDALGAILAVRVRSFDWTDEARGYMPGLRPRQAGIVAQELMDVIPEAVAVSQDPTPLDERVPLDLHHVLDHHMIPYLVRALQQLAARVEELEELVQVH